MAVTASGPPPGLARPPGLRTPPRAEGQQQQQHHLSPQSRAQRQAAPMPTAKPSSSPQPATAASASPPSAHVVDSVIAAAAFKDFSSPNSHAQDGVSKPRIYSEALLLHLSRSPLVNRPASMLAFADWYGDWKPFTATPRFHPGAQPLHTGHTRRDQSQQSHDSHPSTSPTTASASPFTNTSSITSSAIENTDEERSFESWRRWNARGGNGDGIGRDAPSERSSNSRGFTGAISAPPQRTKFSLESGRSGFESGSKGTGAGPFAAFSGGASADGKHVDPIQAFKAEMRERERLERERAGGNSATPKLSTPAGELSDQLDEAAQHLSLSEPSRTPPARDAELRAPPGLSRTTPPMSPQHGRADSRASGTLSRPPGLFDSTTSLPDASSSDSVLASPSQARPSGPMEAPSRSSRFAKFFDGKPRPVMSPSKSLQDVDGHAAQPTPSPSTASFQAPSESSFLRQLVDGQHQAPSEAALSARDSPAPETPLIPSAADLASMQKIMAMLNGPGPLRGGGGNNGGGGAPNASYPPGSPSQPLAQSPEAGKLALASLFGGGSGGGGGGGGPPGLPSPGSMMLGARPGQSPLGGPPFGAGGPPHQHQHPSQAHQPQQAQGQPSAPVLPPPGAPPHLQHLFAQHHLQQQAQQQPQQQQHHGPQTAAQLHHLQQLQMRLQEQQQQQQQLQQKAPPGAPPHHLSHQALLHQAGFGGMSQPMPLPSHLLHQPLPQASPQQHLQGLPYGGANHHPHGLPPGLAGFGHGVGAGQPQPPQGGPPHGQGQGQLAHQHQHPHTHQAQAQHFAPPGPPPPFPPGFQLGPGSGRLF